MNPKFMISKVIMLAWSASLFSCDRAFLTEGSSLNGGQGSIVDNGGDVIHCQPESGKPFAGDYTLDYVMTHNPANPDDPTEATWPELRDRALRLVRAKAPAMAASLSGYLDDLDNTDESRVRVWHGSSLGLSDLRDEGLLSQITENCMTTRNGRRVPDLTQMVRRRYLEHSGVTKVFYYYNYNRMQDLKTRLPLQYSYLVIHEWLWDYADSPWANRSVNHLFHSGSADRMSPVQFQSAMRSYGVNGDEGDFVGRPSGTTDRIRQVFEASPACDFEKRLIVEFAEDTGRVVLDGNEVTVEALVDDSAQRLGGRICGLAFLADAGSPSGGASSSAIDMSLRFGMAHFDRTITSGGAMFTGVCREGSCTHKDGALGGFIFPTNFNGLRWQLQLNSSGPAVLVTPRLVFVGARQ